MDKLKRFLSGNDRDDDSSTGIMGDANFDSMSWSTRIKGFLVCFILGWIISLFGSLALFLGRPITLFAVFYSIGNVVSLLSTCFLMGPVNQIKKMFAPTRVIATIIVLLMIGLTLFAGFTKQPGMALLFMIIQCLSMTWYSLSYIPYARDAVKKVVESCIA